MLFRSTEITRDELKFARFVIRLRSRFSQLFTKILEKQVILKGIMTIEEWNVLSNQIKYNFSKDNYFTELKDAEIAEARINLARNFQDMAGKYYSHRYLRKNILHQSDDDIENMDKEIGMENQVQDPRWFNPVVAQNVQMMNPPQPEQTTDQVTNGQQPPQAPSLESTQDAENNKLKDKMEKIRQAEIVAEQMKKRKGNRTMQDEAKYKAAVQIIAKNRHLLPKMGRSSSKIQQEQQRAQQTV